MAKILIIDSDGVGLSFAWRCVQAGHEVKWFLADKPSISKQTGDGFKGIEKVANWVSHVKWADLIFPTSNDMFIERLAFFKKRGAPVFGPSPESAKLEIDRKTGLDICAAAGLNVAPYKTFKNMSEAKKHVEETSKRFVFKTMGDNENKALTYCSKSPADMIGWIDRMVGLKQEPKGDVMLQDFVDGGMELGVSRWFGRDGFVGPYNESFEHKKLMSGNFGPNTGEMGTIAAFVEKSKLGEETLAKLEKELLKHGHSGDVAIGFMIDKDGKAWVLEWTCRPGWPIFNMMLGSIEGDPAQWMIDALKGKDTTTFKKDIGCCIVLVHGDFPHGNATKKEVSGVPVYGVTKGNKKHLHPQSIKIDIMPDMEGEKVVKRPTWNTSGDYVMVVTGYGKDVKQAAERAYKTAKQLHISNMGLRDDVGESMEKQLPDFHKHGYATHFEYEAAT
jgi:phosphoribosylamine--glycine ligase